MSHIGLEENKRVLKPWGEVGEGLSYDLVGSDQ